MKTPTTYPNAAPTAMKVKSIHLRRRIPITIPTMKEIPRVLQIDFSSVNHFDIKSIITIFS